jgi:ribosomal protein L40E
MARKRTNSVKARKPAKAKPRVCDACGTANPATAKECAKCGSERFAPAWVRQLRRINRSFAVQVTDPHPLTESDDRRLTLYKWWPGNNATFNINSAAQWEAIKNIVDTDLVQYLGWKTARAVKKEIAARQEKAATLDQEARELAERDPRLVAEILRGLKLDRIAEDDLPKLGETIGEIAQILLGVDESHRHAIQQLVKKLPEQGEHAIRQLAQLMEELTIGQITAVASEVRRRVGLLNLFRERVLDERTYEISGDGSIHRLLEKAMWIVDERYWLMHSNKQLHWRDEAAREGGCEVQSEAARLRLRRGRQEADHHRDQAPLAHARRRGLEPARALRRPLQQVRR